MTTAALTDIEFAGPFAGVAVGIDGQTRFAMWTANGGLQWVRTTLPEETGYEFDLTVAR